MDTCNRNTKMAAFASDSEKLKYSCGIPLGTAALGSSQDVAEPTTLLAERESGAMLAI